tara:strand:- start:969 stop:1751 length:783 start_codon:yes stop_codon:yes gene_type:complete
MEASRFRQQAKLDVKSERSLLSIYRGLQATFCKQNNRPYKANNKRKRYRYCYSVLSVIASLFGQPVLANTSSTAAPVAQSSSSVSNQAVQVLQGNLIESQFGNGVVCQNSMLTISPFVTTTFNQKRPQDLRYETPVYNMATDDSGNLTNAGEILYHQENYSANKDNLGVNFGIAATFSIPLGRAYQDACLKSATTQEKIQNQILNNKMLDYELARLKNCGELKIAGIQYAKSSIYHKICEDVIVTEKMGQVIPHAHKIKQ